MRNSKLVNFKELKQIVIMHSIISKKAPKQNKKVEEKDSFLNSFY